MVEKFLQQVAQDCVSTLFIYLVSALLIFLFSSFRSLSSMLPLLSRNTGQFTNLVGSVDSSITVRQHIQEQQRLLAMNTKHDLLESVQDRDEKVNFFCKLDQKYVVP